MKDWNLRDFVKESNRIEGINRAPKVKEIKAHEKFLGLGRVTVDDLKVFVRVIEPLAIIRSMYGSNVRVGEHIAPPGGPGIKDELEKILVNVDRGKASPYLIHRSYENLHPFTDGNGRSGRVLWLWMMGGEAPIGFLHQFYYQTLSALRP